MLPSASASREAKPGENPPAQFAAGTTRRPASCSTMALTGGGTWAQRRRLLLADGPRSALLQTDLLLRATNAGRWDVIPGGGSRGRRGGRARGGLRRRA